MSLLIMLTTIKYDGPKKSYFLFILSIGTYQVPIDDWTIEVGIYIWFTIYFNTRNLKK